jgi:hypothetical protein
MRRNWLFLVVALIPTSPALADGLSENVKKCTFTGPKRVGQCSFTKVRNVETRLVYGDTNKPVLGSGSAINFTNCGYQVSYQQVKAVDSSRSGDRVKMCLVSIPKGCPPGDDRGRVYRSTNLRTRHSWTLPDSEHICGGA